MDQPAPEFYPEDAGGGIGQYAEKLQKARHFAHLLARDLSVQTQVTSSMNYFQMALFLHEIAKLPPTEFEEICRTARKMVAEGVRQFNEGLEAIPEDIRSTGQQNDIVPPAADLAATMRYVSEAERHLRDLRERCEE